jgi:hypothetical protein
MDRKSLGNKDYVLNAIEKTMIRAALGKNRHGDVIC